MPTPPPTAHRDGPSANGTSLTPSGALIRAPHPWTDEQLAGLYDAFPFDGDLPLYLELAAELAGQAGAAARVLELACGSGRVLVPLVNAGHRVVGVDASPHMLALAREKLAAQEPAAGARARLVEADMRSFELDGTDNAEAFDLAIIAVRSFVYLLERADQQRALECVTRHLRLGGLLALDLDNPRPAWLLEPPGSLRQDLLHRVAERGATVSRVESVVSTDLARQVRVIRSTYEIVADDGTLVSKRFVEWPWRFTYRYEAEHLLERAGLTIEHVYGGYSRQPFGSDSTTMLILARRP